MQDTQARANIQTAKVIVAILTILMVLFLAIYKS